MFYTVCIFVSVLSKWSFEQPFIDSFSSPASNWSMLPESVIKLWVFKAFLPSDEAILALFSLSDSDLWLERPFERGELHWASKSSLTTELNVYDSWLVAFLSSALTLQQSCSYIDSRGDLLKLGKKWLIFATNRRLESVNLDIFSSFWLFIRYDYLTVSLSFRFLF